MTCETPRIRKGAAVSDLKLTEQRKFVLWWDANGFNKRGPKLIADRKSIPEATPDAVTLHRWRLRLKDETKEEVRHARQHYGARGVGKRVAFQTRNATPTVQDFGVDRLTLHRWRLRLKDETKEEVRHARQH